MRFIGHTLLAAFLMLGCGRTDKGAATKIAKEEPTARKERTKTSVKGLKAFAKPGEIREIATKILAMVEASRKRVCARPVLRGKAIPGSGSTALRMALSPETGAGRTCKEQLDTHNIALHDAVIVLKDTSGWPLRFDTLVPLGTPVAKPVAQAVVACLPDIDAVRASTQYGDVCAPWRPGIRPLPEIGHLARLGKAASLRMRKLFASGKASEAVALGLDYIRAMQDAGRGGPSLLLSIIAGLASSYSILTLESALNAPQRLKRKVLETWDRELEVLLETPPDFHDILSGEQLSMLLYTAMPMVKGPGWKPPGGWDELEHAPGPEERAAEITGDKRIDAEIAFVTLFHTAGELPSSCPPRSTTAQCLASMEARGYELAAAATKAGSVMDLSEILGSDRPVDEVRQKAIAILKGTLVSSYTKYVRRIGETRFMLAALRLHVALRQVWEKKKKCPTQAMVQGLDAALKIDPNSGQPMKIMRVGAGRFMVSPSIGLAGPDRRAPHYRIECPKKR